LRPAEKRLAIQPAIFLPSSKIALSLHPIWAYEIPQRSYSSLLISFYDEPFGEFIAPVRGGLRMHAVLEAVAGQVTSELEGLDAWQSRQHPDGKERLWSIQQVVEHLVLSYRFTAAEIEARLAKGRIAKNQRRTPLQQMLQIMVLGFGYIPRGTPALDNVAPGGTAYSSMTGRELGRALCAELDAMDKALDCSRGKFGMERVAVHPILGPLRVDQWRRYNALHTAHHLAQIKRVRAAVVPQSLAERSPRVGLGKEMQVPAQHPFA
jgi:hypothetical protein